MSKPAEELYNVTLKHLTRDGKKAAADLPAEQLNHIPAKQLRSVLEAVGALGPGVVYPIEPELRITTAEGMFVVQAKGGKLNLVSWSSRHKGGEYSAERIFAIVTGQEIIESARAQGGDGGPDWLHGRGMMIVLILAIIAINAFTIWFVMQPKKTLTPKYTLLPPEPAGRLLTDVAGVYETDNGPGGRHLEIARDGQVRRFKYGTGLKPILNQSFNVEAASDSQGKPALVTNITSRRALISVKDQLTVVLYGDTYKRVIR